MMTTIALVSQNVTVREDGNSGLDRIVLDSLANGAKTSPNIAKVSKAYRLSELLDATRNIALVRVRARPRSRKLAVNSVVWQLDRARNDGIELLLRHLYLIKYGVAWVRETGQLS